MRRRKGPRRPARARADATAGNNAPDGAASESGSNAAAGESAPDGAAGEQGDASAAAGEADVGDGAPELAVEPSQQD